MAFKNEYRDIYEEMPEWQYLTDIGVRNIYGKPIKKGITQLTIDRKNNYFLIGQGGLNQNQSDDNVDYYALCLDGIVLNLEVHEHFGGNRKAKEGWYHWQIYRIQYPDNWDIELYPDDKLREIIEDAFTQYTYSKKWGEECYKEITVDIPALDEKSEVERHGICIRNSKRKRL